MMFKKRNIVGLFLIVMFVGGFLFSGSTYAIDGSAFYKKTLVQGLLKCYKNAYMKKVLNPNASRLLFTNGEIPDDVFTNEGRKVGADTIKVPSLNLGHGLSQDVPDLSCKQIFEGWHANTKKGTGGWAYGLNQLFSKTPKEMTDIGYISAEEETQDEETWCIKVDYTQPSLSNQAMVTSTSSTLCFKVDSNKNVLLNDLRTASNYNLNGGRLWLSITGMSAEGVNHYIHFHPMVVDTKDDIVSGLDLRCDYKVNYDGDGVFMPLDSLRTCMESIDGSAAAHAQIPPDRTHSDYVSYSLVPIKGYLEKTGSSDSTPGSGIYNWHKGLKKQEDKTIRGDYGNYPYEYKAAVLSLWFYTGNNMEQFSSWLFSEQDRYDLLSHYINSAIENDANFRVFLDDEHCFDNISGLGSDWGVLVDSGKWCKTDGVPYGAKYSSMNVVDTSNKYDGKYYHLKTVRFAEVMEEYKNLDYSKVDIGGNGIHVDPVSPGTDPDNPPEVTCANSSGAESLGWIVCPILSWMGRASNDLYNYYIKPALNVKPALFDERSGENDDVKDAWGIFQNIANIVFVILFLLVIFSQLTGVGIDNYGIKKILPKLIIVAILVNISYYICLIFIDLSNIVGNGIQNMFNWMSSSLTINDAVIGDRNIGFEILSTSVTGAVLLGALVFGGVAVWQNPAILLTLLISGLGVVISILFLFLILSAREAAIVILTVISPLAFVCYMLPNTKNLFDRWRKMGEGLLLVYPICGLLVGGGSYVSKLLLASGIGTGDGSNGFFGVFSAMLISVVPIFFIPTVLRNSFAAMGNLGAKISGFGERLRGGATRGMRNTNAYKQAQERGLERRTRIRAGYDSKGNKKNLGALGRFMRGGRRNMQRESLRYQKMISDRGSLEATEGDDFMLATETANEMKNIVASGEINDMGLMQRSLELALESGNRARIRAYTDGLTAKGEDGRKAVKAAYNAAVSSHRMSTVSAQTFANNIMANHAADYKNNNRSMFEVARNINTAANTAALSAAASTTTDSYVGANNANLAGKVTATTIGNMDDDAFEEMFGGYNGNPVTIPAGASANEIGAAAYAALNDQNANIKAERRKHLEALVESSGYQAKAQNVQEAGIYADSAGRTYRIRRTLDGKYIDDAGFEVDISRLNPR